MVLVLVLVQTLARAPVFSSMSYQSDDEVSGRQATTLKFDSDAYLTDEHLITSLGLFLLGVLFILAQIISHNTKTVWKHTVLHYIPEAAIQMICGMGLSAVLRYSGIYGMYESNNENELGMLSFSESAFVFGMLPPILFNSGFHMKRIVFYSNMAGICALAFFGTAIATFTMSYGLFLVNKLGYLSIQFSLPEVIAFASMISSTDPVCILSAFNEIGVDPTLYYLIFGESLLSDSICVTLFRTASGYVGTDFVLDDLALAAITCCLIFLFSVALGYVAGLIFAVIFKYWHAFEKDSITCVAIFILMIYVPFLLSEALQLNGIVTVVFAGISARQYVKKNLSNKISALSSYIFVLMSHFAETVVFLSLGMSVFASTQLKNVKVDLIAWTFFFALLGRALHVYPMLALVNLYRRYVNIKSERDTKSKKLSSGTVNRPIITSGMKLVIFYSGLRGAVAYSCSFIFPDVYGHKDVIMVTTTAIIVVTILLQGSFIIPVVNLAGVRTNKGSSYSNPNPNSNPNPFPNIDSNSDSDSDNGTRDVQNDDEDEIDSTAGSTVMIKRSRKLIRRELKSSSGGKMMEKKSMKGGYSASYLTPMKASTSTPVRNVEERFLYPLVIRG